jgi:hypothetical protein
MMVVRMPVVVTIDFIVTMRMGVVVGLAAGMLVTSFRM